jgi:hypothetical protein
MSHLVRIKILIRMVTWNVNFTRMWNTLRFVDVESQSLYAISPILSSDLSKHKYLNLVKGSMTPNILLYSKLAPCHLYVTGEAIGEGNSIMKPRTNMKRKGHAQS